MKDWTLIKKLYKNKFGIDKKELESMSDYDVVLLCVSGMSNEDISNFLDIDRKETDKIILKHLFFAGWEPTLSYNPYYFYRLSLKCGIINSVQFADLVYGNVKGNQDTYADIAFDFCVLFDIEYFESERNS